MAHIVAKANGTFEIRESHATQRGPRSRTLASFRTLTPQVIEQAAARASKPLDAAELRRAAQRKGAPVAGAAPDIAAAQLLRDLSEGRPPRAPLARLLAEALSDTSGSLRSNAAAAAAWIGVAPKRRGEALCDLLLLVDSLPDRRGGGRARPPFPRIESRPA